MSAIIAEWHDEVCQVKRMVDAFERFHKNAQLIGSPLFIPILNESRYLARALTDALYYATSPGDLDAPVGNAASKKKGVQDALSRARLAASSALHDTVDEILAITVKSLLLFEQELERRGRSPVLVQYLEEEWLDRYSTFLHAYRRVAEIIAKSRSQRHERESIYLELLDNDKPNTLNDLDIVIDFFLRLRELEVAIFTSKAAAPVNGS